MIIIVILVSYSMLFLAVPSVCEMELALPEPEKATFMQLINRGTINAHVFFRWERGFNCCSFYSLLLWSVVSRFDVGDYHKKKRTKIWLGLRFFVRRKVLYAEFLFDCWNFFLLILSKMFDWHNPCFYAFSPTLKLSSF